jgi:hypothetical protein
MTFASAAREFAADSHLVKLQRLQNQVLRIIGNLPRLTPVPIRIWRSKVRMYMIT